MWPRILSFITILSFWRCELPSKTLFTEVGEKSGISFVNKLEPTERENPYTYRSFYNGAGVTIGDINNDGLEDIYFAGNQVDNKLYLNKGNFLFEDITESAGVSCKNVWSTGVTMVDVNADGYLDIYVCKSGNPDALNRSNSLFINQGDLTFIDKASEYGLDVKGLSVSSAFFDYDKDGDLDCYLLTNSFRSVGKIDAVKDQRKDPDPNGGNRFFRNDSGKFVDFTDSAGIFHSRIGFGLGITLGDFNADNWTDIFISNDFFERDYLYINDSHGGFKEELPQYFQSISMGSMGADFADLNNDGFPELFVTEMLPDSLNRKLSKTVYETWNKYESAVEAGYHYQFSRNTLQTRIGPTQYAEIGRFAGLAATEWSWGALMFDMDNDGLRDIFVANGIYKDLLDRDYLAYYGAEENVRRIIRSEKNPILKLIEQMPSSKFPNYAFKNNGEFQFSNHAVEWGLGEPLYSSGSAYSDLDNDGDLDLVVNNLNSRATLYRNNTDTDESRYLKVIFKSKQKNTKGIGSQIKLYTKNGIFYSDNYISRGFQSSVSPTLNIGLGSIESIDSMKIIWPTGGDTTIFNAKVNQTLVVEQSSMVNYASDTKDSKNGIIIKKLDGDYFRHKGSGLIDFDKERLLPMMYSNESPSLSKVELFAGKNNEIYIDGGVGQSPAILEYTSTGFVVRELTLGQGYKEAEDKSFFIDADGDGNLDIYLASSGRLYPNGSMINNDAILINKGNGKFTESIYKLPIQSDISTSVVKPIDFDLDGDNDLVVGQRFKPFHYGHGGRAFLFENKGHGDFIDVTDKFALSWQKIGMVTDIVVVDYNQDGWSDVIMVGDWMPIAFFENNNGQFIDKSSTLGLNQTRGWWHSIASADLNQDGMLDFVVGNNGLNSFFRSGDSMYLSDFDNNGQAEQIFCTKVDGQDFPIVERDDIVTQLPSLKKRFYYYRDFSKQSIDNIFPPERLKQATLFRVDRLASCYMISTPNGYKLVDLPRQAQYSPIYATHLGDFNNDGVTDLLVGGNQYRVKPQFGRMDASYGWYLEGSLKNKNFSFTQGYSLNISGEIRDIESLSINGSIYLFFAKHNDEMDIFQIIN